MYPWHEYSLPLFAYFYKLHMKSHQKGHNFQNVLLSCLPSFTVCLYDRIIPSIVLLKHSGVSHNPWKIKLCVSLLAYVL